MTRWLSIAWSSVRRLFGIVRDDRPLRLLVFALFAIDLFWISYFALCKSLLELGRDPSLYYHKELLITTDGGIPEWFGYLQTALIVAFLIRLARLTRQPIYAVLAAVFFLVVLDDAMEFHETYGRRIARGFRIRNRWGLRRNDIGEVITWALLGIVVVPALVIGLWRSRDKDRGNGLAMLLGFGMLLFCAIFVDQLYNTYSHAFTLAGVLIDVVEDGGELLSISFILALVLAAERERQKMTGGL